MRVPLSWLKEYVDITIPVELLAHKLTLAGLEVSDIQYIGVPAGEVSHEMAVPITTGHLVWDRDKIVVAHVMEVKQHPNADKLVLAMVESGIGTVETVVTGTPNLYPFVDKGPLDPPLVVVYARKNAEVIDGHKDDGSRLIIKPKNLRGIDNSSMVCSGKELGLSDDHEGIILLDSDALPGTPLQDVLGDVVLTIEITPNMARCLSIAGVAREVAALTGAKMQPIPQGIVDSGSPIRGQVSLDLRQPELNPRFTLALIKGVEIKPSPEWLQRRLRLAGMRPINNIVDVTNYVMLETGQPLHAFDFDVLVDRAAGEPPTIITRLPEKGEKLTTLEGVQRTLDPFTILVCDTKGALSLGGIMGGLESEISDGSGEALDAQGIGLQEGDSPQHGKAAARRESTSSVLLEAANWNFINIRQTLQAQRERGNEIGSEAGYRFSRGVHPSLAKVGLLRGIQLMLELGGGQIAEGILDDYPLPAPVVEADLPLAEVSRLLGMDIDKAEVVRILTALEFKVDDNGETLHVIVPDHRMDIGLPADSPNQDIAAQVAQADLIEDIVRIYGYDRVPETMIADVIPPQHDNPSLKGEETVRDLLVRAGLQEVVTYRLTTAEAETRLTPAGSVDSWGIGRYVTLANPISQDKVAMRQTLLAGMLSALAANARWRSRQALYEIGKVYLPGGGPLPDERTRLCIALTGQRTLPAWQEGGEGGQPVDYFDLKGVLESLLDGLHVKDAAFEPSEHSTFFPGRTALLKAGQQTLGTLGELHPLVRQAYGLGEQPVLAAELDLDALIGLSQARHPVHPVSTYPAIYQDIAVVVDESTPAAAVEALIHEAGGWMLVDCRLFDVFRGDQIGASQKSLAYALTFQAADRTLKDKDADKQREKIVRTLESKLGAKLRK